MSKVAEIIETVKGLTVLELADLVKALEEEFGGVSASASMVAAAPAAAAAEAEEKKSRRFRCRAGRCRREEDPGYQGGP